MTGDRSPGALLGVAEEVLERARRLHPGAEIEVSADRTQLALTRFANSVIHQNVAEDGATVGVRVHAAGRTAGGSTTRTDADGLRALVERTLDAVRLAPLDPRWPGLTPPAPTPGTAPVDASTAAATPADRAERVRSFVDASEGLETAGYCRTLFVQGAFVNSAGQSVTGEHAEAAMDGIARMPGADGLARLASRRLTDIDGAALGARAAAKARAGADPVELAPGAYEVVLEPTAVADVLANLSVYGFNARALAERQSFAELGVPQFDPAVSMVDDAPSAGVGYDPEGTPRRRMAIVDRGTTIAVAHDRRTAAEAGTTSTGHATGNPAWGAFPTHLELAASADTDATEVEGPGADSSVATLVAAMERGVLVTDFFYTRVLDPKRLVITGLTRNGVWSIVDGEVAGPVRNFRFTQAYPEALAPGAVLGIGATSTALPDDWLTATWRAPALHLASWNFTGGASG